MLIMFVQRMLQNKKEGGTEMELNVRIERQQKRYSNNGQRVGLYAVFDGEEAKQIKRVLGELGISNLAEFARFAVVKELKLRLQNKEQKQK